MDYTYKTKGTCSRKIDISLDGNIIKKVNFHGGCSGNTKGIAKIVEGMQAEDVINKFSGIKCGFRNSSCPDQLAIALKTMLAKKI